MYDLDKNQAAPTAQPFLPLLYLEISLGSDHILPFSQPLQISVSVPLAFKGENLPAPWAS